MRSADQPKTVPAFDLFFAFIDGVYDYVCAECGTAVGAKTDNDASEFYRTAPRQRVPPRGGRS